MITERNKLDNPVYNSLNETHSNRALKYEGVKFFKPAYCPFGGFAKGAHTVNGIDEYSDLISNFYIVGEKPEVNSKIILDKNLVCNQMIAEQPVDLAITEQIVELKTEQQKADLSELVNLVQPGYFKSKTSDLGKYFGIYRDGQLISAAGERMKMKGFTEISAVVTHQDHTRKGYAKQLSQRVANQIFSENNIPFLHVLESNVGAIKLYEQLGFSTRQKISFWNLKINK